YEGIDERFAKAVILAELSLGDDVLSGGELAAAVVIDAVTRLLPGVLGDECSHVEDSYTAGLVDCPQYTRPEVVDDHRVPPVLVGGDHEAIRRWRLKQALGRTWLRRPELLAKRQLTAEERGLLEEFESEWAELNSSG
ncbi:MAG TPA: tRNA (guanosine(37)-N1)-methyltransferase TrmD, partial [Gammaproteobacteria bacterium]|nr:tRNA (guanosine(37)-N1)-methyltransferase TrmD [Gammaproteobacteria bacterium]